MRLTVLVPYSTTAKGSGRESSLYPRQHSPKVSLTSLSIGTSPSGLASQQRRGSLIPTPSGSLSPGLPLGLSPTTAAATGLNRRRTVFGDAGWPASSVRGLRIVVCPEALTEALDSLADMTIQTSLLPLPTARPIIILVPLMNVTDLLNPAQADSTPSVVCFPAPSLEKLPPAMSPLERALGHLRRAKRELEELAEDLSQIVLMAYTANGSLSADPELHAAVTDHGGMGILTPPFTPVGVADTFASALKVPASQFTTSAEMANATFASLAQYNISTTPVRSSPLSVPGVAMRPLLIPVSLQSTPLASSSRHDKPLPPLPPPSPEQPELPLTPITGTRSSFAKAELFGDRHRNVSIAEQRAQAGSSISIGGPSPLQPLSDQWASSPESQHTLSTDSRTTPPSTVLTRPSHVNGTPGPASSTSPSSSSTLSPPSLLFAIHPRPTVPLDEQKPLPPLSPPSDLNSKHDPSSSSNYPPLVTSTSMDVVPTSTSIPHPSAHPVYPDPIAEYYSGARRRSVDTGGLSLALKAGDVAGDGLFSLGRGIHVALGLSNVAAGWGWGGWDAPEAVDGPLYAELLCDMFVHTHNTTEVAQQKLLPSPSVSPQRREELIRKVSRWKFEPHLLTPDELLESACILFEALFKVEGMAEETGITASQLRQFLHAVRKIYHEQNKYHNFQHAVDVFQAVYSFLAQAECVPPVTILLGDAHKPTEGSPIPDLASTADAEAEDHSSTPTPQRSSTRSSPSVPTAATWSRSGRRTTLIQKVLENRDLLVVCFAAVGHDVAHPGLSNAFQKNARTPLSIVYDDKSALEQMHCQLLLNLMRKHGLGHLIDTAPLARTKPRADSLGETSGLPPPLRSTKSSAPLKGRLEASPASAFRQLLVQTVLITDMGLHFEWINKLRTLASDVEKHGVDAVSGREDVKQIVCQALIKCGDISNPTRPHAVSEHWSTALLQEWSCQAVLERELGLPVSVVASANEIVQAKGQVGFIDLFTKPLFDTTASVIPSFQVFADQGDINRALWQKRLDGLIAAAGPEGVEAPSIPQVVPPSSRLSATQDQHYRSVFPLSLPPSLLAPLPMPSPDDGTPLKKWPELSTEDNGSESNTPTLQQPVKASTHRGTRAASSVSSISSATMSSSPFSPGAGGDSMSTAESSPASQAQSLAGDVITLSRLSQPGSQPEVPTTPMRAAFNASVRRKMSFHRQSLDIQSVIRAKGEQPPPLPSQLGTDRSGR
ncbi:3',5'-cyclic-nucleotide phosphodiesterase [Tulasnella sp. JGI-2019a]|nr:3',5'-cyclic-nucleotide phosphodiesterase [Tulasnella sp. JGI-2019a]